MKKEITIHICTTEKDFEIAKLITQDYMKWLGMDLSFQKTDGEFEVFNQMYGYPDGCFIYAKTNNTIVGGVGCRKLDAAICEMKRLYVYEEFQGLGIGRKLCDELVAISESLDYKKMRLDTVAKLKSAIKLYEKIGFVEIPKYYENPDKTAKYMELEF
ncbi:MAG: GNAT family N-acetyltransferase [Chloroflexia bacterium]|nr:GNAT family N-acetyltransferase [Chloroflexia bacterium]